MVTDCVESSSIMLYRKFVMGPGGFCFVVFVFGGIVRDDPECFFKSLKINFSS